MLIIPRGTNNPTVPTMPPYGQPVYVPNIRFQGLLRHNMDHTLGNDSHSASSNGQLLGTQLLFGLLGFLGLGAMYLKRVWNRRSNEQARAATPSITTSKETLPSSEDSAKSAARATSVICPCPPYDFRNYLPPMAQFLFIPAVRPVATDEVPHRTPASSPPAPDVRWSVSPPPRRTLVRRNAEHLEQTPFSTNSRNSLATILNPKAQLAAETEEEQQRPPTSTVASSRIASDATLNRQGLGEDQPQSLSTPASRNTSYGSRLSFVSVEAPDDHEGQTTKRSSHGLPSSESWASLRLIDGQSPFSAHES